MTRVFDEPAGAAGGTRVLILGASAYPHAQSASLRVPALAPIDSAAASALTLAARMIGPWRDRLPKPLASVDLLVDTPAAPAGASFTRAGDASAQAIILDAPTMSAVKAARRAWMKDAGPNDVLFFYACGHGIWLPDRGRTFLTASFGEDQDNPWLDAVALSDFALALGDAPPRLQWLIFDCCVNTPPEALAAMVARANPLLTLTAGERTAMSSQHGHLSQVIAASASTGNLAYGKAGRPSYLMEAFLEACEGAGCRRMVGGRWWVDQVGLEEAMSTYAQRVAPFSEEREFSFPRVTQTDAPAPPLLLSQPGPPACTLVVRSNPRQRLKQAQLTVRDEAAAVLAQQAGGVQAQERFRRQVPAWKTYQVEAVFPDTGPRTETAFALPPVVEALF